MIKLTGASGFVGTNLHKFLKRYQIDTDGLNLRSEDWNLDNTDVLIHLAGKAHDLKNPGSGEEYYQVNTALTKKVFDAFLKSGARVFIMLSSVKAVADSVEGTLTEQWTPAPSTHYGRSKLLAEQYVNGCDIPAFKRVYILRPCMIHGPGNKGNLNLLFKLVQNGIPYPLKAFSNKRSFLSIDNLCFTIKELIERDDIPSGIYNVADQLPLSTNDVVSIISTELGRTGRLINVPKNLVDFFARIGDRLGLPFNTERLGKLTENYVVDTNKLIGALGAPLPIGSEEGLRKTIRSFISK